MPRVTNNNVSIYYECYGNAEKTIVFAHGMGGNGAIWFNQIAALYDRYRIITFDHRYFARSACTEAQYDPKEFPNDTMAIMDAEGVQSATFVCQSMGGWTGSQMAVHHADRVDALVMSHTPGIFTHPEVSLDVDVQRGITQTPAGDFRSPAIAADLLDRDPAKAVLYTQISAFNNIDNALIGRAIGKAKISVNIDDLAGYAVPTLFLSANHDTLFPHTYIEGLAGRLPGAQYTNLGDAGHSSYFEVPQRFNERLDAFLNEQG